MTASVLEARGLVKSYGGRRVVDEISLQCSRASVLGLLGPNGAGKTTTLRMLYGFIEPEQGAIEYEGRSFATHREELKRLVGVCTQDDTLDYDFTVEQNLRFYASYFRPRPSNLDQRTKDLLEQFELAPYASRSPRELSGGFKRRLMIARSVVHAPRVLFLDEPTTGLDPKARVDVWELVDAMRSGGMAIVLTTHYMDEAERLSDDLLVLSHGKPIATGRPEEVLGHTLGEHVLVVPANEPRRADIAHWAERASGTAPAVVLGELRVPLSSDRLGEFSRSFGEARFTVRPPNLDDLFLKLALDVEPEVESHS